MRIPPNISIKSSRSLISNALYLPESKVFSSEIDISVLQSAEGQYNVLVIVRVPDDSIDSLDDTKIAKSDAFAITGEVRTIQIGYGDTGKAICRHEHLRLCCVSRVRTLALAPARPSNR
jgi:hypothetical protein